MLDDEFFDCWEAVTKSEMSSSSGECFEPVAKTSFSWLAVGQVLSAVGLSMLPRASGEQGVVLRSATKVVKQVPFHSGGSAQEPTVYLYVLMFAVICMAIGCSGGYCLSQCCCSRPTSCDDECQELWITWHGKKYHSKGCHTLKHARELYSYSPCSSCKPDAAIAARVAKELAKHKDE